MTIAAEKAHQREKREKREKMGYRERKREKLGDWPQQSHQGRFRRVAWAQEASCTSDGAPLALRGEALQDALGRGGMVNSGEGRLGLHHSRRRPSDGRRNGHFAQMWL